ncbi:MarR family winged helix-turn-helix transcriptional regulator [Streptomyces sp. NPDC001410]|uniref:MarR family winged helix-turn-helix transcriptional regulator n=1 Tax=Streptomyces sp. NPDC001410 TaxID=3364574 RepID=UPI003679780F
MKPIGYWLNRTDQALTRQMDALLAEYGLSRLTWQVLNVVRAAPGATDTEVHTTLGANADTVALAAAIRTVVTDGWATRPAPGLLTLTAQGDARLAAVTERVAFFREAVIAGISLEEYGTAVRVLERMTRNLEGAPVAASTG